MMKHVTIMSLIILDFYGTKELHTLNQAFDILVILFFPYRQKQKYTKGYHQHFL